MSSLHKSTVKKGRSNPQFGEFRGSIRWRRRIVGKRLSQGVIGTSQRRTRLSDKQKSVVSVVRAHICGIIDGNHHSDMKEK